MRMVGASNWYIRIPFMIEGVLIGALGAIVPCLAIYYGYQSVYEMTKTGSSFALNLLSLRAPFPYIWTMSGVLTALGCGVGLVGSFFSVKKFLKF